MVNTIFEYSFVSLLIFISNIFPVTLKTVHKKIFGYKDPKEPFTGIEKGKRLSYFTGCFSLF